VVPYTENARRQAFDKITQLSASWNKKNGETEKVMVRSIIMELQSTVGFWPDGQIDNNGATVDSRVLA
jgi:hypothetical protein